ncbi:hypothetical protein JB92DRAFT_1306160 [Gautieria morchelliformis]|nr:hypothetical protein JB92DRAFT_1306160 [Gautieria morchelliformis]
MWFFHLHASCALLPSFFRRFTLVSARHSNILCDFANHHGSRSSAHSTATSRAPDGPANPAPPRGRRMTIGGGLPGVALEGAV